MTRLLTIQEVADMLQVHPKTVRRAIDTRGLPAAQVAGRGTWRIRREDLDEWLDSLTDQTPREHTPASPVPALRAATGRLSVVAPSRRGRRRRSSGRLTVPAGSRA